jgi:hypothetical protein
LKKIISIVLFISLTASGQRADFFKEDITFRLDKFYFDVEGYYWFANHSDKPVSSEIYYPFPVYKGGVVDSIRLYNISAGQKTRYSLEGNNGISFHLFIPPHDTVLFQIGYRQKISGDSAIYILKTTKGWGKPLVNAEYKLIAPDNLNIKKFTYPPDKLYNIEKEKIYYWKMENFMPDNDMKFNF